MYVCISDLKGHFENIFYVLTWDMGNLGFL